MMRRWKGRRPGDHPGARPAAAVHRRWLLPPAAAAAAVALALVTVACGGSGAEGDGVASAGGSKSSGNKSSSKRDPQQAGLDFARCMREHGVDVPDPKSSDGFVTIGPGPGEGGPTAGQAFTPPAGFEEADKACRHFLDGLIADGDESISPEEQDRALKFSKCMREHGIDMPDPDFSKGGVSVKIGEGFDPTSQAVKDAHKACQKYFGPANGEGGVAPRGGRAS